MQAPIPSARQVISGNEPGASAARVALWLASPLARRHFDPSRLNDADAGLSRTLRNPDRAEEFVISRSLQQYLATPATTPQSLSHSGRYAALALAPAGIRVGVDIEQHRPRDLLAIARFAFAAEESAALAELEGAALEQEFYARWVMKEAMAKALQLPLLVASRECRFIRDERGWSGSAPADRPWRVIAYEPSAGMSLAIALVGEAIDAPDRATGPRTYEWPPPRHVAWRVLARVFSQPQAARETSLPAESSTCRAMLPT